MTQNGIFAWNYQQELFSWANLMFFKILFKNKFWPKVLSINHIVGLIFQQYFLN